MPRWLSHQCSFTPSISAASSVVTHARQVWLAGSLPGLLLLPLGLLYAGRRFAAAKVDANLRAGVYCWRAISMWRGFVIHDEPVSTMHALRAIAKAVEFAIHKSTMLGPLPVSRQSIIRDGKVPDTDSVGSIAVPSHNAFVENGSTPVGNDPSV